MAWYDNNSQLQVYIPIKLKEALEDLATKERRSVSKIAVELLELGLVQKNKQAQPIEA